MPGDASSHAKTSDASDNRRHNLDFIGRQREAGDFHKASRHTKRVGRLKYLLPIVGMVIIALLIAALIVRKNLPTNLSIGKTGIEDGMLIMSNPKLNGFDPKRRPYTVEAERAIQSVEDPTHVELETINANLPMEDGVFAKVIAGNGSYDATEKKLELGGGIDIVTTDNMTVKMTDAYIDLKAGTMSTHRSLTFTSDTAQISAQSMEVFENGDHIIFDTNVRLVIQPPPKSAKPKKAK